MANAKEVLLYGEAHVTLKDGKVRLRVSRGPDLSSTVVTCDELLSASAAKSVGEALIEAAKQLERPTYEFCTRGRL